MDATYKKEYIRVRESKRKSFRIKGKGEKVEMQRGAESNGRKYYKMGM
jgi:hypothetical protein